VNQQNLSVVRTPFVLIATLFSSDVVILLFWLQLGDIV